MLFINQMKHQRHEYGTQVIKLASAIWGKQENNSIKNNFNETTLVVYKTQEDREEIWDNKKTSFILQF